MKRLKEFIGEGKVSSESMAKDYFLMTVEDNDEETIEDDIEIFLDKVGDMLYDKGGAALYQRFQKGILKFTEKF